MIRAAMVPRDFSDVLYDYCLAFSGTVTLWVTTVARHPEHARASRGSHLLGLGADVQYDGARPGPTADEWLAAHGLRRIEEGAADHIEPTHWSPT